MAFTTRDAFSLLYYLVFVAYGYSSHAVSHSRMRTAGHWTLTAIFTSLAIWSLALLWRKVGVLGWGTLYSLLLHFVLYITGHHAVIKRKSVLALIYAPVAVNLYAFLLNGPLADRQFMLVLNQYGWVNLYVATPFNTFHTAYTVAFTLLSGAVLIKWYINNRQQSDRRVAQMFLVTFLLALGLSMLLDYSQPRDPAQAWPMSSVIIILLPAMLVLAVARRRNLLRRESAPGLQETEGTEPTDRARERIYHYMGLVLYFLAYANLYYYVLIHATLGGVADLLQGMMISAALMIGSEVILNLNRLRISTQMQERIVVGVIMTAIVLAYFWFTHTSTMTIWASIFLFIIVASVFRNPKLMLYGAGWQAIYQVYLMLTRPYTPVTVDPTDYVARILFILAGASVAYYVNTVYIARLQENERQTLFQRTIARISLRLTSFKQEDFTPNMIFTLQAIRQYMNADCVLHISLKNGTLADFHTSDSGVAEDDMPDDDTRQVFVAILRNVADTVPGNTLAVGAAELSHDPRVAAFVAEHDIRQVSVTRLVRNERLNDALLVVMRNTGPAPFPVGTPESERQADFLRITANALTNYLVRRDAQQQLHYLAYHDQLTGLYKLDRFHQIVQREISLHQGSEDLLAVFFVDMDAFKEVNDVAGHDVGNMVLKVVASRLFNLRGEKDVVARFGGDEFLYMTRKPDLGGLREMAQRIIDAFREPVAIEQWTFFVSASVGIALYPWDGDEITKLMTNADFAMYEAKHNGRNRYSFYSPQSKSATHNMVILKNDLRNAITRGEMSLAYQPQVSLKDGSIVGVEALLRWRHPKFGMISPAVFLPLAEQTDWIHELGRWVLELACAQGKQWLDQGFPDLRIGVNASYEQFRSPLMASIVESVLMETGLPARNLEIEITETMAGQHSTRIADTITRLTSQGVTIAIDDYGTDFSTLSRLYSFPFHRVKIDKTFVDGIRGRNQKSLVIIENIISLVRGLNLSVIAEGVETLEQVKYLHALGCDEIQGYFFHRPMPAQEIGAVLKAPPISLQFLTDPSGHAEERILHGANLDR